MTVPGMVMIRVVRRGKTCRKILVRGRKGLNGGKNGKQGDGSEQKEMPKEVDNGGNVNPVRKEGTHHEECGLANMCTVEESKLVACLRVPGDDEQGKGPLVVSISALEFLLLEKTKVEVKEKNDAKVDVSVGNGVATATIVLKADL